MLNIYYLLVNDKTIMLSVDFNYEFTNGMTILYLTYYNYAHTDV